MISAWTLVSYESAGPRVRAAGSPSFIPFFFLIIQLFHSPGYSRIAFYFTGLWKFIFIKSCHIREHCEKKIIKVTKMDLSRKRKNAKKKNM